MPLATSIQTEAKKAMTVAQELSLALAAHIKAASPAARARLIKLLSLDGRLEEVVTVLENASARSFQEEHALTDA